jgi:hypothetical protein
MKKVVGALIALIALGVGYAAYPYWALHRIERAIIEGDTFALESMIDFAKVRTGAKADFKVMANRDVAEKSAARGEGMAVFVMALGSALIDNLIESKVTAPELIRVVRESPVFKERVQGAVIAAGFVGPMTFRVDIKPSQVDPQLVFNAMMELDGFSWRVTRVILPMDTLKALGENQMSVMEQRMRDRLDRDR